MPNLEISLELSVEVSGTFVEAEPDVGLPAGIEDPAVDSISIEWKPRPITEPRVSRVSHSIPTDDQREWRKILRDNPNQAQFTIPRLVLIKLLSPIPEWLENHILEKYMDSIVDLIVEEAYG